jgi:proline dehydrogenase
MAFIVRSNLRQVSFPYRLFLETLATPSLSPSWVINRRAAAIRCIHNHTATPIPASVTAAIERPIELASSKVSPAPVSHLTFITLLRSYIITACTSFRVFLSPSIRILSAIAYSKSPILSPDRNRLLHWLLKRTIYAQFCAGETPKEVQRSIEILKQSGVNGILLGYGREVEVRGKGSKPERDEATMEDIKLWTQGTLETIKITPEGNFVSMKYLCPLS